ncbi:MAG: hypothetical protein V1860_03870 [bacterium]
METSYTLKNIQFSGNDTHTIITLGILLPNGTERLDAAQGKNIPEAICSCIEKITGIALEIINFSLTSLRAEVEVRFNKRIFRQTHFDTNPVKAMAEALLIILPRLPRK